MKKEWQSYKDSEVEAEGLSNQYRSPLRVDSEKSLMKCWIINLNSSYILTPLNQLLVYCTSIPLAARHHTLRMLPRLFFYSFSFCRSSFLICLVVSLAYSIKISFFIEVNNLVHFFIIIFYLYMQVIIF